MSFLGLVLPALLPSWRFFDAIGPSPRVEAAWLGSPDQEPETWREVWPRPTRSSWTAMIGRLVWNPDWNERLYLTTCAEAVLDEPTQEHVDRLVERITSTAARVADGPSPVYVRVRIVVIDRENGTITTRVDFCSEAVRIDGSKATAP